MRGMYWREAIVLMSEADQRKLFAKAEAVLRLVKLALGVLVMLFGVLAAGGYAWWGLNRDVADVKIAVDQINTGGSQALQTHVADEMRARYELKSEISEVKGDVKWLVRELAPRPTR